MDDEMDEQLMVISLYTGDLLASSDSLLLAIEGARVGWGGVGVSEHAQVNGRYRVGVLASHQGIPGIKQG